MKRVLKYDVPYLGEVDLPIGARVLHVGEQVGQIVMWVEADLELNTQKRKFHRLGTGSEVPPHYHYIGTVQVSNGLVDHVYEVKK